MTKIWNSLLRPNIGLQSAAELCNATYRGTLLPSKFDFSQSLQSSTTWQRVTWSFQMCLLERNLLLPSAEFFERFLFGDIR